jgi:hypothetical protein
MNPPTIRPQRTPNPNAMKFTLDRRVVDGTESRSINNADAARGDPVAEPLFAITGVTGVFMVDDFVTVMKAPDQEWEVLMPQITDALSRSFS